MVLGLDISTTTVGYAFTKDNKILDMGFIDITKYKTPKDKAFFVLTQLLDNTYIDKVEKINVEDNLSGFANGRTSQQIIIKLAKFNAVLGFLLEEEFSNLPVKNINPLTARKQVFGKARIKGIKAKDFVKTEVESQFDTSKWCKETKRGNWDKRNIDMYDGLVMSLYKEKA